MSACLDCGGTECFCRMSVTIDKLTAELAAATARADAAEQDARRLRDLAEKVTYWDWSDNDEDCVRDIDNLRAALAEQEGK